MLREWVAFGVIIIFGLIGSALGISMLLALREMGKSQDRMDKALYDFSQNMAHLSLCWLYSLHGNGD
ncbi:hypothetical protein LCGC14_1121390 [marine sediment metagenome]|uniref:Uncharacterized protein n=1 Tax=marine sediment metagenome TaxID=412755 RepID=A0A0F9M3T9_9ZZZZ